MSILYCSIPHFAAALIQRDDPGLQHQPLVLIGPDERVFAVSAEAAACAVTPGLTPRAAEARCPQAKLVEADVTRCRAEFEALLQLLEHINPLVEPHGWGAAYVDLDDLALNSADAIAICSQVGQAIRRELGESLQPALGWDSTKFTAQAAAKRTQSGHLLVVAAARERAFLRPLPIALLPLGDYSLQRLEFLGLRTLGQYAALPPAAVLQQFGQAGRLAQKCAQGEDTRPVIPRSQERRLVAHWDSVFHPALPLSLLHPAFLAGPRPAESARCEHLLTEREQLLTMLRRLVAPLLQELRQNLQACGQVRLTVRFVDDNAQERERTLLFPTADEERTVLVLGQLADGMQWRMGATALQVTLERIQDSLAEQLTLFPMQTEKELKLLEVQSYLQARFGANRLRRAILAYPAAPLPEWRTNWLSVPYPRSGRLPSRSTFPAKNAGWSTDVARDERRPAEAVRPAFGAGKMEDS
jgi:nucleotidyltransferase/DNA polymerase involved in DNA repair